MRCLKAEAPFVFCSERHVKLLSELNVKQLALVQLSCTLDKTAKIPQANNTECFFLQILTVQRFYAINFICGVNIVLEVGVSFLESLAMSCILKI